MYSNKLKGGLQTLALGLNLNAGLIQSPPNDLRQFSHSTIHVRLPYSDGFPQLSGLPTSPRFPSLCMIPYWDFYNHLCLLYPYQNHSKHALLSWEAWLCMKRWSFPKWRRAKYKDAKAIRAPEQSHKWHKTRGLKLPTYSYTQLHERTPAPMVVAMKSNPCLFPT